MPEYFISKTDDRLTLRRTKTAIFGRCMSFALVAAWAAFIVYFGTQGLAPKPATAPSELIYNRVVAVVFGAFFLYVLYKVLVEGWWIIFDRKNNTLSIDGRIVCRLNQVLLETKRLWTPPWLPEFFHMRILILRVLLGEPAPIPVGLTKRDISQTRRIQLKVVRSGEREAAEAYALVAAIAEMLPEANQHSSIWVG